MFKKAMIILLIVIMVVSQGLSITGCGKKEQPEANQPEQTNQSSDNTLATDDKSDEQVEEQTDKVAEQPKEETSPPPPNPYPDGIVKHNPETYFIETWGVYNDEFERPNIEVPEEAIERLGEYALEWPEYINKAKSVEYNKWGENIKDRYFYLDDGFVDYFTAYPEEYELCKRMDEKYRKKPSKNAELLKALGIYVDSYVESTRQMHEGKFYKIIKTDKYEYEAVWDSKKGYYYIDIEGKDWVPNRYKPLEDEEYDKYDLVKDGVFKFYLDDEATETIKYLLSNALKRNEVRLVIMKLKEIQQKVNQAMESKGLENAPYEDMEELKDIEYWRTWPYIYHMFFDTYMSVSFALTTGGVIIDVARWPDENEFKRLAKDYYTGTSNRLSHVLASRIQKHLGIEITK